MARITVTSHPEGTGRTTVLLEESVLPIHLQDQHAAWQLLERIAWALADNESLAVHSPLPRDHSPRSAAGAIRTPVVEAMPEAAGTPPPRSRSPANGFRVAA
jgi:hypothetical protein